MASSVVKESLTVYDARRIPDTIARAVRIAFSGRRGPVHLTIPIDIQDQEIDENEVVFYNPDEYRASESMNASPALVQQAVALMREAKRPFVIAGDAAGYAQSGEVLQKFAETTRMPVLTEGQARGMVGDDHPYGFGFFERGLNRAATKVRDADLVIMLGRKQDYTIGFGRPPHIAVDAKIIQIDPSAAEIGRNRGVNVGIVGDVTSVLEQITQEAAKHTWQDLPWLEDMRASRAAQAEWAESLAVAETPMHAMYVAQTVASMLRPDDVLTFDGGDYCHFSRSLLPSNMGKRWFYVSTLGMLGTSLPYALAAQVAYPDSRVLNFTGDGAFGFNGMEFDTAVRHKLNVVTVMGNDSAWGIDRQIQLGLYGRTVGTELLQTRYDQVVQGLGGHGEFVEKPEDVKPAIERAFASGKPALVNVAIQGAISPRAEAAIARRKEAMGK
jgi:acetolactate synthase-1/2/3 large subunit